MTRLFTFGCSYTMYCWPTWANIIACDKNYELYNYGWAGIGNVGISQRVLEADCKYNFKPDDVIMINWSSWCREDSIKGYAYSCNGSIFVQKNYKKIKDLDFAGLLIKNYNAIIYTSLAYKNLIAWQGTCFPDLFENIKQINLLLHNNPDLDFYDYLHNLYKIKLEKLPYIKLPTGKQSFGILHDSHPDVLDHLHVAKNIVDIRPETEELCKNLQNDIINVCQRHRQTDPHRAMPIIKKLISERYPQLIFKDHQLLE